MSYWERRYIKKQLAQASDGQTYVELMAKSGICSGYLVKMAATNGATGGGGQDIIDIVSKIEVIGNGSDVLYSLSGIEIAKWSYLLTRRRMSQLRDDRASAVPFAIFPILFGRNIGDQELWIDTSAYNTLELKITYSHTPGATLFLTGTIVIDIIGIFYARGVLPKSRRGWLRTVQVRNFTSAASGEDESILSSRFPMTNILVYAFKTATAEGGVISDIELRVNNRSFVPFVGRWVDIQELNEQELDFDPLEEFACLRTSGNTIETRSGRIIGADTETIIAAAGAVSYPLYSIASVVGGTVTIGGVLVAGTALAGTVDATTRNLLFRSRGMGIGNAAILNFARNWDLDAALPNPSYDDVRIALTQAAAAGTVRISTQELVAA